ncbi:MAG: hypothetical protein K2N91_08525, partial [Muribaculaceae bacterium]|nr:hypothetical protein [Muribaculaceae bacterium]
MKQEIGLLIVFLLVFLYDLFMPRNLKVAGECETVKGTSLFTLIIFGLYTVASLALCCCPETT